MYVEEKKKETLNSQVEKKKMKKNLTNKQKLTSSRLSNPCNIFMSLSQVMCVSGWGMW